MKDVLKAWRDIEPSDQFEQRVWQRISTQSEQSFTWSPLWASAIAMVAGILIGLTTETFVQRHNHVDLLALNRPGTIAGDYAQMLQGE